MKGARYVDGTLVSQSQLQNTEDSKISAIKERFGTLTNYGIVDKGVGTPLAISSVGSDTFTIAAGEAYAKFNPDSIDAGYAGTGERIYLPTSITIGDRTQGAEETAYIFLCYIEIHKTRLTDQSNVQHYTKKEDSFIVLQLSAGEYTTLTTSPYTTTISSVFVSNTANSDITSLTANELNDTFGVNNWSTTSGGILIGSITATQYNTVYLGRIYNTSAYDSTNRPYFSVEATLIETTGLDADFLDGQHGAYYAVASDLTNHISDTTTHGVTGDIVGVSDTQTLTNKTLTSPTINTPTINTPTINGSQITASGTEINALDNLSTSKVVVTDVNGILTTTSATSANLATLTAGSASNADSLHAHTSLTNHISDTATHGVTGDIVGVSDTQTLTNKTLTSPTINTPTINGSQLNASGTELNILDGATISTNELNGLDGLAASKVVITNTGGILTTSSATSANLATLTAGSASNADGLHSHRGLLIAEQVLTSNQTQIDFTGLSIDTDKMYILEYSVKSTFSGTYLTSIYFNGNTTTTDYYQQDWTAVGGGLSASSANDSHVIATYAQYSVQCGSAHIQKSPAPATSTVNDMFTCAAYHVHSDPSGTIVQIGGVYVRTYNTINADLTSITISCGTANGIMQGSYFRLYKAY